MAACPQCQRPLAVARPQCLYRGAARAPALVPSPAPSRALDPSPPAEVRAVVLLLLSFAPLPAVMEGLGIAIFDAEQRIRRGGWQLHRVASPAEAEAEAARLRALGLTSCALPEPDAAAGGGPMLIEGGRSAGPFLELRAEGKLLTLASADVLLVIGGLIQRERQAEAPDRRRPAKVFAPSPGYRFHVHRVHEPRPLEIDPESFAFDEPLQVPMASLLELRGWLETLVRPHGIDDGFRFVPPALGVAGPREVRDAARLLEHGRPEDPNAQKTLDNLAQFRFYSGWRGAAERHWRAGADQP